jgi:hypothetical protein
VSVAFKDIGVRQLIESDRVLGRYERSNRSRSRSRIYSSGGNSLGDCTVTVTLSVSGLFLEAVRFVALEVDNTGFCSIVLS